MSYYYVDYENVHYSGLDGIEKLESKEKVFIFCRENQIPPIKEFLEEHITKAEVRCIVITSKRPNAADFSIVAALSLSASQKKNGIRIIVSKDRGFDAAIETLMREKVLCFRISYIGQPLIVPDLKNYGEPCGRRL